MQKRLYQVTHRVTGNPRLVEAINPAQAMRHVANSLFDVKAATARDVANLMGMGIKLEQTGDAEVVE